MESIVKYEPPVDALLALGEVPFNGKWLDYETYGLHRAHIPALVQMATDRRLHLAAGDKAEVWAPLHAWRALGQQRAVTAVIPLLELMDEYEDDDWIHGEIPVVIGMVEAAAIAPVRKFLAESHHALYARVAAARVLHQRGQSAGDKGFFAGARKGLGHGRTAVGGREQGLYGRGPRRRAYEHGAINLSSFYFNNVAQYPYNFMSKNVQSPQGPSPGMWWHTGVGAAIMGALMWLQYRFVWWPFHPLGFPISCVFGTMWFSVFIAWAIKSTVLKYGGLGVFERLKPFFLGLILGEAAVAGFWVVVDFCAGMQGSRLGNIVMG